MVHPLYNLLRRCRRAEIEFNAISCVTLIVSLADLKQKVDLQVKDELDKTTVLMVPRLTRAVPECNCNQLVGIINSCFRLNIYDSELLSILEATFRERYTQLSPTSVRLSLFELYKLGSRSHKLFHSALDFLEEHIGMLNNRDCYFSLVLLERLEIKWRPESFRRVLDTIAAGASSFTVDQLIYALYLSSKLALQLNVEYERFYPPIKSIVELVEKECWKTPFWKVGRQKLLQLLSTLRKWNLQYHQSSRILCFRSMNNLPLKQLDEIEGMQVLEIALYFEFAHKRFLVQPIIETFLEHTDSINEMSSSGIEVLLGVCEMHTDKEQVSALAPKLLQWCVRNADQLDPTSALRGLKLLHKTVTHNKIAYNKLYLAASPVNKKLSNEFQAEQCVNFITLILMGDFAPKNFDDVLSHFEKLAIEGFATTEHIMKIAGASLTWNHGSFSNKVVDTVKRGLESCVSRALTRGQLHTLLKIAVIHKFTLSPTVQSEIMKALRHASSVERTDMKNIRQWCDILSCMNTLNFASESLEVAFYTLDPHVKQFNVRELSLYLSALRCSESTESAVLQRAFDRAMEFTLFSSREGCCLLSAAVEFGFLKHPVIAHLLRSLATRPVNDTSVRVAGVVLSVFVKYDTTPPEMRAVITRHLTVGNIANASAHDLNAVAHGFEHLSIRAPAKILVAVEKRMLLLSFSMRARELANLIKALRQFHSKDIQLFEKLYKQARNLYARATGSALVVFFTNLACIDSSSWGTTHQNIILHTLGSKVPGSKESSATEFPIDSVPFTSQLDLLNLDTPLKPSILFILLQSASRKAKHLSNSELVLLLSRIASYSALSDYDTWCSPLRSICAVLKERRGQLSDSDKCTIRSSLKTISFEQELPKFSSH